MGCLASRMCVPLPLHNLGSSRASRLMIVTDTINNGEAQKLEKAFVSLFGGSPRIFRAPGRVNLIGEHTDYNDGFVMPAAIEFFTWVAVATRSDRKLVMNSENFPGQLEFDLDRVQGRGGHHWGDYVAGVARILEAAGHRIPGANLLIRGNVPIGAGLSSSASLEVAVAASLLDLAGKTVDPKELALLCQRAENEFVGARCGIMDQFVVSHGRHGQALLLDCRSLAYRLLPLSGSPHLVICNTMVRHSVASGQYNSRRAECDEGVRLLAKCRPGIKALRDVEPSEFTELAGELPPVVMRRCRHVISENARVEKAADTLERGEAEMFGKLMAESHASLRDDFEVSCPELDLMVELASNVEGVYGSRMTGGGFGGCTVNLVRAEHVEKFKAVVTREYASATGTTPEIYVCSTTDGVTRVS
jgi:galactokinase